MLVLAHKLQDMALRVSLTVTSQFIPMQKFVGKLECLDTPDACEPTGPLTMRAAQFTCIFVENGIGQSKTFTEALKVYESIHEALPAR